jgi:hypothetical protein
MPTSEVGSRWTSSLWTFTTRINIVNSELAAKSSIEAQNFGAKGVPQISLGPLFFLFTESFSLLAFGYQSTVSSKSHYFKARMPCTYSHLSDACPEPNFTESHSTMNRYSCRHQKWSKAPSVIHVSSCTLGHVDRKQAKGRWLVDFSLEGKSAGFWTYRWDSRPPFMLSRLALQ